MAPRPSQAGERSQRATILPRELVVIRRAESHVETCSSRVVPLHLHSSSTAKHRFFCFLDEAVLPDDALMSFASDDAFVLGVLSSRVHVAWAMAAGSTLEDRPRYIKTLCFERFAFPDPPEEKRRPICKLAETLDAHRKRQQSQDRRSRSPTCTMFSISSALVQLTLGEGQDLFTSRAWSRS